MVTGNKRFSLSFIVIVIVCGWLAGYCILFGCVWGQRIQWWNVPNTTMYYIGFPRLSWGWDTYALLSPPISCIAYGIWYRCIWYSCDSPECLGFLFVWTGCCRYCIQTLFCCCDVVVGDACSCTRDVIVGIVTLMSMDCAIQSKVWRYKPENAVKHHRSAQRRGQQWNTFFPTQGNHMNDSSSGKMPVRVAHGTTVDVFSQNHDLFTACKRWYESEKVISSECLTKKNVTKVKQLKLNHHWISMVV